MTSRSWMFTYNNPQESGPELIAKLQEQEKIRYAIFQLERGEEGTPHFQGYIELKCSQRLSYMRKIIACHWEKRRGTRQQAREYCSKEETREEGPWTTGSWEAGGQGARNDLIAFKEQVKEGKRKRELIDDYPLVMAKYTRFYDTIKSISRPRVRLDLTVRLNYGKTGTGKTRNAYENEDLYVVPVTQGPLWFDGYDGEEVAVLDDFAGAASKLSLTYLLRLIDIYPIRVPVKGSYVWWQPKRIIITTNIHPRNWYDYENRFEQYLALERRIHEVYLYKEIDSEPENLENQHFFHVFEEF